MNTKEILEKLKLTFNELVNNAAPEAAAPEIVAPTKAKLVDGTEVEITELAVGGIVSVNGAPAPVGEHTLEDSTILVVGDNGAIVELKQSVMAPEEPAMEEDMKKKLGMEEIFSAFEVSTNEKFASYETKFAEYEAKLERATKVIEGLLSLTQTLAEAPTGVPDQSIQTSNNFNEQKKKSYDILFN